MDLSYCVVNTNGRELLLASLASIRDHGAPSVESEVLVYDNASDDGSADAVAAWNDSEEGLGDRLRLIRGEQREGKAALDSALLRRESRGLHYTLAFPEPDPQLCRNTVLRRS